MCLTQSNVTANRILILFISFFYTSNVYSNLEDNESLRFLSKVASSHFSMKHIGEIAYLEDKLSLDLGLRLNVSSKSEVNENLTGIFSDNLSEFTDSLSSIRSNFIEATVGNYKGLSFHFQTIPMITYKDFTFTNMGVGVQWSYLDFVFEKIPFSSAIKIYLNKTSITHPDDIMTYGSNMLGIVHLMGKQWKYFSAYAGVGYAKTDASFAIGSGKNAAEANTRIAGFHSNLSFVFTYEFLRLGAELSLIDDIKMVSFKTSLVI